ncbi:MAG TPA: hypothetical protein VG796_00585 [Verrucomicrobiales bacterium]|nr:hypothetical protein [Verrucomicrobiales bacterium]
MSAPIARFMIAAACIGGGVALDRYLLPPPHTVGTVAPASTDNKSVSAALSSAADETVREKGKPFTGGIAELLRLARQINDYQRAQIRIFQLLEHTPAADIAKLVRDFPWRMNLPWQENGVYQTLLNRWADLDPAAALAWAQTLTKPRISQTLSQILGNYARTDPEQAIAFARKISNVTDRNAALENIANSLASTDPRRALSIMNSVKSRNGEYRFYSLYSTWAATDPEAAHAAAMAMQKGRARANAMQGIFSSWAASDPKAANAAAQAIPEAGLRHQALSAIFESWGSSDPQSALAAVQILPKGQAKIEALGRIFSSWAGTDPSAAAAAAASLPKRERQNAISYIAGSWGANDPAAALAWAKTIPAKEGGEWAVSNILSQQARTDGPAAVAAWRELPASQRSNPLREIVNNWMNYDREGALAFARSLERPQDKASALSSCLRSMDFSETTEINALLAELPQGQPRQQALRNLAENRAWQDPEGTLDWLTSLSEMDRATALKEGSLGQLAYSNPQKAAEVLKNTPEMASQPNQWSMIAGQLAGDNPAAALAWAEALETPGARKQSIENVMQTWGRDNGPEAIVRAQAFTDPATKKSALSAVINSWADVDPDAVLKWAQTASGEAREMALLRGSIRKAGDDPASSAAVVDSLIAGNNGGEKTPSRFVDAASDVARNWFSQDTAAASAWALQLPEGDARDNAVRVIAEAWTSLDAVAASQWVQQLPPGRGRDFAAQRLSEGIADSDPESAFTWASSIGDDSKRDDAVRRAAQTWHNVDENAALAAVMQARISDNVRKSLLEQFDKND